jgi:hypothetical protein
MHLSFRLTPFVDKLTLVSLTSCPSDFLWMTWPRQRHAWRYYTLPQVYFSYLRRKHAELPVPSIQVSGKLSVDLVHLIVNTTVAIGPRRSRASCVASTVRDDSVTTRARSMYIARQACDRVNPQPDNFHIGFYYNQSFHAYIYS